MEGDGRRPPSRVAVISDPHGDMVALDRVAADLHAAGPLDEVLVGGDLAQGGAQPAEVVDEIRRRGWRSVRGNGDDLLVRIAGGMSPEQAWAAAEATHGPIAERVASHALWSVRQLGPDRIAYLRALPMSVTLGPYPFGSAVLVHATPWSTEDVVLPDAGVELARRMVREAGARLLLHGHVHTPYQRRVDDALIVSVGAVSGSNDGDARPAYTIVELGAAITVEVRRLDWPAEDRRAAYAAAGVEARFLRDAPGPLPVRSRPGVRLTLWPPDQAAG